MTTEEERSELPAPVRRWVEDADLGRREEADTSDAGWLGFIAGLPVVWIALAGVALMDPPWVLGLALPLLYLVAVAPTIRRAAPGKRRAARKMLAVGMVAGVPWLWGLFLFFIVPVSAAWLCGWAWRRASGRGAR